MELLKQLKDSIKKVRQPKFRKPVKLKRFIRRIRAWKMDGMVIVEIHRFRGQMSDIHSVVYPSIFELRMPLHEAECLRDVLRDALLLGRPMQYSERRCYDDGKGSSKTANQVLEKKARCS